jgi:hypothetical protein
VQLRPARSGAWCKSACEPPGSRKNDVNQCHYWSTALFTIIHCDANRFSSGLTSNSPDVSCCFSLRCAGSLRKLPRRRLNKIKASRGCQPPDASVTKRTAARRHVAENLERRTAQSTHKKIRELTLPARPRKMPHVRSMSVEFQSMSGLDFSTRTSR